MASGGSGGAGDPRVDLRLYAFEGIGGVYARHGLVFGAIADAAGHDPRSRRHTAG